MVKAWSGKVRYLILRISITRNIETLLQRGQDYCRLGEASYSAAVVFEHTRYGISLTEQSSRVCKCAELPCFKAVSRIKQTTRSSSHLSLQYSNPTSSHKSYCRLHWTHESPCSTPVRLVIRAESFLHRPIAGKRAAQSSQCL